MKRKHIIVSLIVIALLIVGAIAYSRSANRNNNGGGTPTPTQLRITQAPSDLTPTPTGQGNQSPTPRMTSQVNIYLIVVDDNGKSGPKIGCGDSVLPVTRVPITPTQASLKAALEKLFSFKSQYFGETGLYNSLYQSNLAVQSATIDSNGRATVRLTGETKLGGTCDSPRFKAQIEETIRQFPTVKSTAVFINGKPIDEALSTK